MLVRTVRQPGQPGTRRYQRKNAVNASSAFAIDTARRKKAPDHRRDHRRSGCVGAATGPRRDPTARAYAETDNSTRCGANPVQRKGTTAEDQGNWGNLEPGTESLVRARGLRTPYRPGRSNREPMMRVRVLHIVRCTRSSTLYYM